MGNGRCQTSGKQPGSSQPWIWGDEHVLVHGDKWKEFIDKSDLGKVNIYDYYLGGKKKSCYTKDEHLAVLKQIFEDAVAVGAIEISGRSGSYEPSDFDFKLDGCMSDDFTVAPIVLLKEKPTLSVAPNFFYSYLTGNMKMGDECVHRILNDISKITSKLLEAKKALAINANL